MDRVQNLSDQIYKFLSNPYVTGLIAIVIVVYGSFVAVRLPPAIARLFNNPIFRVVFIFGILAIREFSPMVSILLTLALLISLHTLSRYKVQSMGEMMKDMITLNMAPPEVAQIQQEIQAARDNLAQQPSAPVQAPAQTQAQAPSQGAAQSPPPVAAPKDVGVAAAIKELVPDAKRVMNAAIHPMNRPTPETPMITPKVFSPDDPNNPGWARLSNPNVDVSIYELNPPYAQTELPLEMGKVVPRPGDVFPPQFENLIKVQPKVGDASRYSAYHGYTNNVPQLGGDGSGDGPAPLRPLIQEVNANLPYREVPLDRQQLPLQFAQTVGVRRPTLPTQGETFPPGYQSIVGQVYAQPTSEM